MVAVRILEILWEKFDAVGDSDSNYFILTVLNLYIVCVCVYQWVLNVFLWQRIVSYETPFKL